jgi:hypothetical protein
VYITRYPLQILMKIGFYRCILEKYPNIKFHANPSSGSRVFPADGQTDKKHESNTVAFSNFAKAPKNHTVT